MINMQELREQIICEMDLSRDMDDAQLLQMIHRILEEKGRQIYIPLQQKADIGRDLFNAFRKLDILQELLEDEEITEIMINGPNHVFIEKEGRIIPLEKQFSSRSKLEDIIQQIVASSNRMVNEATPIVDARLEDGSRVNVVLYPIALNGPIVTIRKFPKEAMTIQKLIEKETFNLKVAHFLKQLMIARYNVFISGGTGSG